MNKTPQKGRHRARPRSRLQRILYRYAWVLPVGAVVVGAAVLGLTYAFASIPLPQDVKLASAAEVYDRNGKLIGIFSGEQRRFLIDARKLLEEKPFIGEAVVAAEDRAFYEHNGISMRGIVRAAWANLTGGEIEQGGSTITQQYVKNAVLRDASRTVTRKVKEAVLAIKMERRYSKEEILAFYLNTIYLGRGAYGFEAGARAYFDKSADELTLSEAAFLAGVIPAPESYQPDEQPDQARARRDEVLTAMLRRGAITQAEFDEATTGPVKVAETAEPSAPKTQTAAYFMEWLRRDVLEPEYGGDVYTGGFKIYTTLDLKLQDAAEKAIRTMLPNRKTDPQAALVSMTPTGAIRALVGGRPFHNVKKARGFNFATSFPGRAPGSSLKPFTLLGAIQEGISPSSAFAGYSPMTIADPECAFNTEPWEVDNYGGSSYGTISLETATTNSVNTVFAQLVTEVGVEKVHKVLDKFQYDREATRGEREIPQVCSLALGQVPDVTPLEHARAYAGLAARGRLPEVQPIRYIEDSDGNCIRMYRPNSTEGCDDQDLRQRERVAKQNDVDVLNEVLTGVVEGGTATAANIGRPVAGKTGTSQNNRDAWFAGFVPQLATVVWMGHPSEMVGGKRIVPEMRYCSDTTLCRPVVGDLGYGIDATGGSFPARIWAAFMTQAVAGMPVKEFPVPEDLPDDVINEAPDPVYTSDGSEGVAPPSPTPDETAPPEPTPEPEPEPEPTPTPNDQPTILPTPQPSGSQGRGDDKEGP